jgi:signal transduction histidine kinase
VGQLAAGLAHGIGTPLHVLAGRARSLQDKATDAEAVRKNARILVDQCERITRIVDELLRYARTRPPERMPTSLGAAAAAVLDLLGGEARRAQVRLHLEQRGEVPLVLADADHLQQILLNLVRNALGATAPGGEVLVRLGTSDDQAWVRLEVKDTGVGIPDEAMARLFEPFFTTHGSSGGTGLGLPVVKTLVQAHGGQIDVASSSAGSSFVVLLPRGDSSTAPAGVRERA